MTKTKRRRVLWIDDESNRERDAENLCDDELQVDFELMRKVEDVEPNVLSQYDLLLVDYKLDKLSEGAPLRGPVVVGLLRSVDDDTPAYLVSNASRKKQIEFSGLTWFELALTLAEAQDVRAMRKQLKRDIDSYRAIQAVRKNANVANAIVDLLQAPETAKTTLLDAVPASVKASLLGSAVSSGSPDTPGRLGFARWVRRVLLERPGPLLPSLHAATRVGFRVARFEKSRPFRGCMYGGIFGDEEQPRWWAASLDDIVYAEAKKQKLDTGLPWVLGPKLYGVPSRELPLCAVCNEPFPEVVARDAQNPKHEAAVHQRHSTPDAQRDFTPFFVEERIFGA